MMQRIIKTLLGLLFTIKIFNSTTYVESKPQTGVITGGYAGVPANSSLNYNMTNTTTYQHADHMHMVPQMIVPATTIERGVTLSNGCFKQIVREPDYTDVKRFIYTEQLICPPGVNITMISQQYQKPSSAPSQIPMGPMLTTQPDVGLVQPNFTGHPVVPPHATVYHTPAILPVPVNATPIVVLPPPSYPSAPLPAVLTQQKDQPAVFQPRQPVMAEVPNVAASQVIVLSQKTGYYDDKKKTNSASTTTLLAVNSGNVILIVMTIFTYFM